MATEYKLIRYLDAVIKEGLFSTPQNLCYHMRMVFAGIDFQNRTVLDVGGGSGLYSFYAAVTGAEKVLCLEPEGAGSWSGMNAKFHRLKQLLACTNVEIQPLTLQAFDSAGEHFDLILSHNSINHLDETACINLLANPSAKAAYHAIFSKIYSLSKPGATLVLCDCSRYNFFPLLKLRNPFAPTIQGHKH